MKFFKFVILILNFNVAFAADISTGNERYRPSYPVIFGITSPQDVVLFADQITSAMRKDIGNDPKNLCSSVHAISVARRHLFATLDIVKGRNRQLEELWKAARAISFGSDELLGACKGRGSLNVVEGDLTSYEEPLNMSAALKVREMIAAQAQYIQNVGKESYYLDLYK